MSFSHVSQETNEVRHLVDKALVFEVYLDHKLSPSLSKLADTARKGLSRPSPPFWTDHGEVQGLLSTFQVFAMPSAEYPITPSAMHLGKNASFLNAQGRCI